MTSDDVDADEGSTPVADHSADTPLPTDLPVDLLLGAVSDVVVTCAPNGTVLGASPSLQASFGWTSDEVVGRRFALTEPSPWLEADVDDAAPGDYVPADCTRTEVRVRRRDGSTAWAQATIRSAPGTSAAAGCVLVVLRDVSEHIQDERALAIAEARLRNTSSPQDVTLDIAPGNRIRWASDSVADVLGWPPSTLEGRDVDELLHPEDSYSPVTAPDLARQDSTEPQEFRMRCSDGTYKWVLGRSRDVEDVHGDHLCRIVRFRDFDARVRAEHALMSRNEEFDILLSNIPDVVIRFSAEWIVLWASPSLETTYGWSPDEIIGTAFALGVAEDQAETREHALAELAANRATTRRRMAVRHKDGSTSWAHVSARLVRAEIDGDGDGEPIEFAVVVYRDVTAEVAAEQALAESEERYRLLAEYSSDFVLRTSPDAVIEWVSPSVTRVLGWRPEDLVGRRSLDFLHPEDLEDALIAIDELATGDSRQGRNRVRRPDGSYRWVSQFIRAVRDESGAVIGRISGWRDIQAEVEAEDALAASEERYRRLIGDSADFTI